MAKKKKATKTAPKKAAKTSKAKTNGAAKPARKAGPRSQTLPGMEQVRNRSLDRICEGLGEVRDEKARIDGEEASLHDQAVRTMERDRVTAYRHAGIELALVPGGTKLRIRKLKDKTEQSSVGAATTAGEETTGDEAGVTADEVDDVKGVGADGGGFDAGEGDEAEA